MDPNRTLISLVTLGPKHPVSALECMAGTTGLEPATSAVTVIHPNVSYRKQKHGRLRKALKSTEKHP